MPLLLLLMTLMPLLLILRRTSADITTPCSEPDSSCVISCTEPHSCYAMDIDASLSTSVLFNCSKDHSCEHLNVIASDIPDDHNFDEHSNFTIVCAGESSCNDAAFDISGEYALTLDCLHPNSCVDTAVTLRTPHNDSTENSSNSDLEINFSDSCSEFLLILCVDEASQCSLYCDSKYVLITAEAFRATTIDDVGSCFEQQFTHSCPADDDALKPSRAYCPTNHGVITTMITETIWNVRKRVNANLSDYCTHTPYHGEFEKRITTMQPSYDMAQNEGQGLRNMSVVVAIGSVCVMLSIFVAVTREMCRRAYRMYHKKFISALPPIYYLWGPFVCDMLIFIAFYWWLIKGVVFESTANAYCSANYPVDNFAQFRVTCDNDDICQLDKSDGAYECISVSANYYIWRWVVLGFFTAIELCRCCFIFNPTTYFGIQCLCCTSILCCDFPVSRHEAKFSCGRTGKQTLWPEWPQSFWIRRFWEDQCCLFPAVSCDRGLRYGVHFLFAFLHYALYSPLLPDSDAVLQWYDVWPVLALVILKISLHISYLCGEAYDPEKEKPHKIREILVDELENSTLAAVVESYLPFYHDSRKCPVELMTREARNEKQASSRPAKKTKTKGTYEQCN